MKTKEQKFIEENKDYVNSLYDYLSTRSNYSDYVAGYSTRTNQCKSNSRDTIPNVEDFNDDFTTLKSFYLTSNYICKCLLNKTPIKASLLQEFADGANLVCHCFDAVKATMLAFPPEIVQDLNSHLNILNYGKHNVNSNEREG